MDNPFSPHPPHLEIIEETDRFLAVCKPGGLLTQAPSGIDSMEVRVKQYLAQKTGDKGKIYLGVPHRLDRPASGVMVFAKNIYLNLNLFFLSLNVSIIFFSYWNHFFNNN